MSYCYDVVSIGEILIDFTEENGKKLFQANPGGAPCNVLSLLSKHNVKTAYICSLSQDFFGEYLYKSIKKEGIDVSQIVWKNTGKASLAFIKNDDNGEREFLFYRTDNADDLLTLEDIDYKVIENSKIFHFGSLSLIKDPIRSTVISTVNHLKNTEVLISFDPNYRESLWNNKNKAREMILWACSVCDLLKIEVNELKFLTGIDTETTAVEYLFSSYNIKMIAVTKSSKGASIYTRKRKIHKDAFYVDSVIDTTGAGDAFCASLLYGILQYGIEPNSKELENILNYANAAGALIIQRKAAMNQMPSKNEILNFLDSYKVDYQL